jgi:adenylate cyclase
MNPSGPDQGTPSAPRLSSIRRSTWLIVAILTITVVCLSLLRPPLTELIELKLYDLKFQYRGPLPVGQKVAIVAIDDDSLKSVGRWPWPREVFAEFLKRLQAAQPRVIGLDIIFAEKSYSAVAESIDQLIQKLRQQGLASDKVLGLLQEEKKAAELDRRLAETISQGPPAVLGFYFKKVGAKLMSPEPPQALSPTVIQVSSYNMVRRLDQQGKQLPIIGAEGVEVNLPIISAAAAGGGYFNMIPDLDGAVRWYPMAIAYGPYVFAPLSLVTLQHSLDNAPLMIALSHAGVKELRLGRQLIPVDRYGRYYINYLGPAGSFPTYSAAALLEGKLPPGTLKDKIVLVGATAVGIYDMRITPFSGVFPGVEIQATIIDNVLRRNFLRTAPYSPVPELLIIIFLGLVLGFVLPQATAIWILGFALLLLQGYVFSNYLVFRYLGVNLDLLYPLLEIILVSTGVNVYSFLIEERARASLKKAFQSYVAPSVVDEIIKHPERLRLGGERRELTIFFCDIRNFTALSETLEPEEVVSVLHGFLNPMSKIVVKHGGTIDKFMGDAIMALFGAPLHYPDHASRACKTALEMQTILKSLNQEWEGQGRHALKIGVGINTGLVSVGNMGSDTLFDYTAIGDNVNLASRLEGLNKTYATEIIVSHATAQALDQEFILRELDRVRVKGRKQPVAIFELLGLAPPDLDLAEFLHFYHQGLHLFLERQWDESIVHFKKALWLRPRDYQSLRYCSLAQEYRIDPPGPDWQGIATMVEK